MLFGFLEGFRWMFLLFACFTSFYYWNNYKEKTQKYFPLFLLFTVLIEGGASLSVYVLNKSPYLFYNVYLVASGCFILSWVIAILKNNTIAKVFLLLFICVVIYSIYKYDASSNLYGLAVITNSILILLSAFLFFKELLEEEEVVNFLNNQQFWIMSSLLIFHIGFLPVYLLIDYLNMEEPLIAMVIPFLNILLYGCFIIAFRCRTK